MVEKPVVLPEIEYLLTPASSPRHGHPVQLVVVHRWGVRYLSAKGTASSFQGVIKEFQNVANEASAHFVYPGSAVNGGALAAQMVPYARAAWTEAAYNPWSVEVESADAIWLGHDYHGFHVLARIVAFLLHKFGLPPAYVVPGHPGDGKRGFCRHADLGSAGGGHTQCPTTNLTLWQTFVLAVQHEHERGGFRASWGR